MKPEEIAKQLISGMGSQIDLLVTLAVAIFGGIIALSIQIAVHNHKPENTKIQLCGNWLLILALATQGTSIVFGYFARGAITDVTPLLFNLKFSADKLWISYEYPHSGTLITMMLVQFGSLFLGILCVFFFILCNRKKVFG